MLPSRLLACASLVAASLATASLTTTSLRAQQFQLQLPRDVLGQTSLSNLHRPAAADLNGDGTIDLLFSDDPNTTGIDRLHLNQGSHFVATSLGVPPGPWGDSTLFDIDGDGDVDIFDAGGPRLLRNEGSGTFVDISATHLPPPAPTFGGAEAADIDGDGDLDLLMPFGLVLQNDGQGSFSDVTATNMVTNGFAIGERMAVADFDGDGDVDFVIMSGLHRNDGHGVFTLDPNANATHLYGEQPTACDVDMDGDIDVLLSSGRDLRNDGTGIFTEAANFLPAAPPNQSPPWSIDGFADLDGDGAVDILLVPYSTASAPGPSWARNDGQGTFLFGQAQLLPVARNFWHRTFATDLDGDGDNDLVAADSGGSVPQPAAVLYNDGTGNFHNATQLGGLRTPRTFGRLVVDFDDDGDDDIVGATFLQRNDGKGNLTIESLPYGMVCTLVADFNDDGLQDALGYDSIWFAQGGTNFVEGAELLPNGERARDAAATDLDSDGDLDLVVLSGAYGQQISTLRVLYNDGSGIFTETAPASLGLDLPAPRTVAAADFDGDGHPDLVFGNYDQWAGLFQQTLYVFNGSGSGQFSEQTVTQYWWQPRDLHIADIDGDGDLDFCTESSNYPVLYTNDGTGAFSSQQLDDLAGAFLAADDADLDGDLDLWSNGIGWPTLYVNDGNNAFTEEPSRVASGPAPTLHSIAEYVVIDLDRDGDRDVLAVGATSGGTQQYYVPLWNHVQHLRAPHLTTIGGELELFLSAIEAPTTPLAAVGVSATKVDVPTPFGTLGIDLTGAILTTATLGAGTTVHSLPVPNDPVLQGLELHAQALLLTGAELRLTGTVTSVIVP